MIIKLALPLFALTSIAACSKPVPPQPIPVVAEQRICPTPATPPADLMIPPRKVDFLPKTP